MNGNCGGGGGMWQALVCCGKRGVGRARRKRRRLYSCHKWSEWVESLRRGKSRRDELNRRHQQRRALNVLYLRARQTTCRSSPYSPLPLVCGAFSTKRLGKLSAIIIIIHCSSNNSRTPNVSRNWLFHLQLQLDCVLIALCVRKIIKELNAQYTCRLEKWLKIVLAN